MSFVVDKATNVILYSSRSNETIKFVVSSILDTAAVQHGDFLTRLVDKDWFTDQFWITHDGGGKFSEYKYEITSELIKKREIAYRRAKGYYLLLEQATIVGCSYDNLSDLSTDDLPMYYLHKEQYIKEYARCMNMSVESAGKHLNFLAESLLSVHFRKQTLIWKYGNLLKLVETELDFLAWRKDVLNETVGIGQV
jgi:hypothetical protein